MRNGDRNGHGGDTLCGDPGPRDPPPNWIGGVWTLCGRRVYVQAIHSPKGHHCLYDFDVMSAQISTNTRTLTMKSSRMRLVKCIMDDLHTIEPHTDTLLSCKEL